MVELRKRPAPPAAPPPAKKKAPAKPKAKKEDAPAVEAPTAEAPAVEAPAVEAPAVEAPPAEVPAAKPGASPQTGDTITLSSFGGEVQTNDEQKVTLAKLVEDSKAGVVLFTYPKASTPGCTTQVCLFRDSYEPLTKTGLSIYGLSNDSPKSNTTFKTKQKLPYTLLCDPNQTLISAIGMKKPPKGTTRGVFVVDKSGKVLAAQPGSPAVTVEVVKALVEKLGGDSGADGIAKAEDRAQAENKLVAGVAAEVADSAAGLDRSKASTPVA